MASVLATHRERLLLSIVDGYAWSLKNIYHTSQESYSQFLFCYIVVWFDTSFVKATMWNNISKHRNVNFGTLSEMYIYEYHKFRHGVMIQIQYWWFSWKTFIMSPFRQIDTILNARYCMRVLPSMCRYLTAEENTPKTNENLEWHYVLKHALIT